MLPGGLGAGHIRLPIQRAQVGGRGRGIKIPLSSEGGAKTK